jgi:hypothetical protein
MLKILAGALFGVLLVIFAPRLVGMRTTVARPATSLDPSRIIFDTEAYSRSIVDSKCEAMNEQERSYSALATKIYKETSGPSWIAVGVVKFFGHLQYRHDGKNYLRLCPPVDLIPEVAKVAIARNTFAAQHLFVDEIRLARFIGPRDPAIVRAVARTAFHQYPIYAAPPELKEDIRPLARVVLSEFGNAASEWSEKAYSEMGTDNPLQLTATDIAIATGYPGALQRVVGWMNEILKRNPDMIPRTERNIFYHLAYALAGLGADARDSIGPVLKIMNRKVQSWAPPFGMILLPPRRMCRVLRLIGGQQAEAALQREPCLPELATLEQ